ncbi:TPA: hypothetical protein G8O00_000946 [Salmonella enterica]|uniref:IraD/Gp25-like domain-containing protein n=1 Tax=Salmonella enterica TaxID=28901 RepID=A0A747SPB2_SALER|nr:hypothetical protein [Salmonella enterica]HAF4697590.1 hypothetical protein [Salmonella enterica]
MSESGISFIHRLRSLSAIHDDSKVNERDALSLILTDLRFIFSSRHMPDMSEVSSDMSGTILNYGISDIDSVYCDEKTHVERLRSDISTALSCFEPRLKNTVVTFDRKETEYIFFLIRSEFLAKVIEIEIVWSDTAHHYSVNHPVNDYDRKVY